jgi:hypothetical protein
MKGRNVKTPKLRVWDSYKAGKSNYLVLHIGPSKLFPEVNCYHSYEFDTGRIKVYAVNMIDTRYLA